MGSSMTEQDREWVKAVAKDITYEVLKEWSKNCPVITKMRGIMIGIAIGFSLGGIATGAALAKVLTSIF